MEWKIRTFETSGFSTKVYRFRYGYLFAIESWRRFWWVWTSNRRFEEINHDFYSEFANTIIRPFVNLKFWLWLMFDVSWCFTFQFLTFKSSDLGVIFLHSVPQGTKPCFWQVSKDLSVKRSSNILNIEIVVCLFVGWYSHIEGAVYIPLLPGRNNSYRNHFQNSPYVLI